MGQPEGYTTGLIFEYDKQVSTLQNGECCFCHYADILIDSGGLVYLHNYAFRKRVGPILVHKLADGTLAVVIVKRPLLPVDITTMNIYTTHSQVNFVKEVELWEFLRLIMKIRRESRYFLTVKEIMES